jgi:sterol desaturase/sphingolipid hydroxylase (fatty acid hydroxylase superfamily)
MPSPLEIILHPVSLVILAFYAAMMIWEAIAPGRKLPKIKGWILRSMTSFAIFFFLSSYLPLMWDEYLAQYQLMDLSGLGTLGGAVVGFMVYELLAWVWHWAMHKSDFLWRSVHQMHHSAERIDTYSAFYFSPLDMVGWTFLSSLCFALIMGLNAQANTIILLAVNFLGIVQHSNVKTPHWMGYIVQRPESHSIHHGRGIHKYNYADLPLIDMMFGTFRKPKQHEIPQTGFYEGASKRVTDMLLFKDVSQPASN